MCVFRRHLIPILLKPHLFATPRRLVQKQRSPLSRRAPPGLECPLFSGPFGFFWSHRLLSVSCASPPPKKEPYANQPTLLSSAPETPCRADAFYTAESISLRVLFCNNTIHSPNIVYCMLFLV